MRQVYEVLRWTWASGLSDRQLAHRLGLRRPTVAAYVPRAQAAGLSWPLPEVLDEEALERLLVPPPATPRAVSPHAPDWAHVHQALPRKGVTLWLLWQEDKTAVPEGCHYSWFCQAYRTWTGTRAVVMRQSHRAGEQLFVDYAGHTLPMVNGPTGEGHAAPIFLAVLGASNSPSAEATWRQNLSDWIGSHVRTFAARGGVPEIVVPDTLKAAVIRAQRYAPESNRTYAELAHAYRVAVLPARAARPRDKAQAAVGVHVVERWILATLRHQTFCSLPHANHASAVLCPARNARPFTKLPGSRHSLFASIDRPALRPLPALP